MPVNSFKKSQIFFTLLILSTIWVNYTKAQTSLGLEKQFIQETRRYKDDFALIDGGEAANIFYDENDYKGVIRAIGDLSQDFFSVSGVKPELKSVKPSGKAVILIGTLGKSKLIDQFVSSGKLNIAPISGKWESFIISTVKNPFPGIDQALVIAGSDKRGTIYGIYEVSEQLGVSPWYWWADVPPKTRKSAFALSGSYNSGEPAVKYRGIFINDEAPAMTGWAKEKFGGMNSKMYTHMFELLLRLRANYLWPAMWSNAFNEDDPENPRLADEYGIVMGTSHHEPMIRAQQEWKKHGVGAWNYATNPKGLNAFWQDGIKRNKNYESLVTMGMRGDGDEPMVEGGDMASNVKLLENIITDQRKILAENIDKPVEKIPQLWALYKEVKDYYDFGMKVPDDITLLWADDNWGNLRHLPTAQERKRSGGSGIYYHFDYVGAPRNYKWLNTTSLPKVWEQMNLAYHYGADRIWVVNVGDLKPMEIPIEFFLRMAWNPEAMSREKLAGFLQHWATREFGTGQAKEIADLVRLYAKYTTRRKPELLSPETFSLINFNEAQRVSMEWKALNSRAAQVNEKLPQQYKDAFYQLVYYPIQAMKTVTDLYIAVGKNRLYFKQGRAATNLQRNLALDFFKYDQQLSDEYNYQLAGGKWNHMMDQVRIGYTSWNDPKKNIMPKTDEIQVPSTSSFGVAIDGSSESWPSASNIPAATLPQFESLNKLQSYFEVFAKGAAPISFQLKADQWIRLKKESIPGTNDYRILVDIDWTKLGSGKHQGKIQISGNTTLVVINVIANKATSKQLGEAKGTFASLGSPIAFEAFQASKKVSRNGVSWEAIPGYGRGASGMSIFPVTSASLDQPGTPTIEYPVFFSESGEVKIDLVVGPTVNFSSQGLRVGISVDGAAPQILTIIAKPSASGSDASWANSVKDNARTLTSSHFFKASGRHTVKIWMVDPAVVLEKIIVYKDKLSPSYLGPMENEVVK
ncbi:glycosyl hydrolase 115 family protein [Pedobacter sp. PF22-3]|uniref:glycosyl hydrolase 115 family protein n=1 Tax=Pedobacter sp. PF22-3 TaxID=2994467 RepID=UPI0022472606|nr:glycosyl hydrolase 115 family protein [Pedobacter sp. PF22-3]MCX2492708.1 glycosyl hydrolase 115 family protein [Pedobacter sp. PF22-3]